MMMAMMMAIHSDAQTDKVYDKVEVMPVYPGGVEALLGYMQNNMKYPEDAKKQKIEGRVVVGFIVEKDGSITEVHSLRAVHPLLEQEAIRVVSNMPKWKPGKVKGKAVRVSYALPVNFKM